MNFLADESVDRQIVEHLRQDDHNVLYVAEMAPGITDEAVLDQANREGLLLLTADKDFGEIVFRQRHIALGVVLIRLAGLSQERKAEIVALAVNAHSEAMHRAFTVVTPGNIRMRSMSS